MNVRIEEGWRKKLAKEFNSEYFERLVKFVRNEYATQTIYPPAAKIFAAFDMCPFQKTKVVILGQDPYHGPGQANGLCFSVNDGVSMPPSLVNILREVSDNTCKPMKTSGNLESWAKQGVLLLNATLTVRSGAAGSHQGHGWETFTDAVIATVSADKDNCVFILWGSWAASKRRLIDTDRHLVLTSPHPSPLSAYRGFAGNKHFLLANEWLVKHGKDPIQW